MTTQFEDWLARLAVAGKRIPDGSVTIDRDVPFEWEFQLTGDYSAATFTASLRQTPDASGATVEDFTIAAPSYDSGTGRTTVTLSLNDTETMALPADDDGDGVVWLAIDILMTPSGGTKMRLMGGLAAVAGRVTVG